MMVEGDRALNVLDVDERDQQIDPILGGRRIRARWTGPLNNGLRTHPLIVAHRPSRCADRRGEPRPRLGEGCWPRFRVVSGACRGWLGVSARACWSPPRCGLDCACVGTRLGGSGCSRGMWSSHARWGCRPIRLHVGTGVVARRAVGWTARMSGANVVACWRAFCVASGVLLDRREEEG